MSEELKVSFYLRHKEIRKDGTVPIMGRITIGKQMAQFSAKLSVAISLWDIKAARALGKSKVATELNRALDKIVVSIHASHEELIERKGTASPKEVAVAFQGMASGQESLLGYCDKFHKMMLQRVGINLKAKSCDQYRMAFKYLREFIKAKYNLKEISFGALDYSFIEKFDHYLRIERKFKANSVVGIIGKIKLMVKSAITDDVIVFDPFISFRSEGEESKPKTLTRQKLEQIMGRKYQASKEHLGKSRPAAPLKRAINQAFAGATNKEQLRYNLFQSGIGVVYRQNAAGRLYGVTFIDHNTGVVLNGSRLGKEYAANAIADRLENPQKYEYLTNNPQPQSSAQFTPQQQPLPAQEAEPIHRTEQHLEGSSIGGSIGSLFDIPILPNGDDPEEEMFRRRMQRKKKKGRRM